MPLTDSLLAEDDTAETPKLTPRAPALRGSKPRNWKVTPEALDHLDALANMAAPAKAATPEQTKPKESIGLLGTLKQGAKGTLRALGATVDTAQGDEAGVVNAAKEQAAVEKDPDLADFYAHIDERKKALTDPSLWEGIKAVGSAALKNPRGFGLMIAEQAPNSVASLGAGGVGALAGSFAGPVGTVVGGLAGLGLANIGLETGNKALEAGADGSFGPAEQSQVRKEGLIKGATITGVDIPTLGMTKWITGTTRRAVERATTKTLSDAGVDVTNAAARKAALTDPVIKESVTKAQELAKQASNTLGKRLARTAGAVGLETVGEGAGEYLGEFAATGKANTIDAVIEAFAGFGQSAGEIALTSALNRQGLKRLFDNPETAEKTAAAETKKTGIPYEAIPHPTEPDKFVAVPKTRSASGIEFERDAEGNLTPISTPSTQADFNLANKPGFQHTAEDKVREQEQEKAREAAYAANPIIVPGSTTKTPIIAGKPVTDMSNNALIYTVSRGSARAQKIASDELARRDKQGIDPSTANAPETPVDTVNRIIATGAERAKEDAKNTPVIPIPTPAPVKAATAPKTKPQPTPEPKKVAKPAVAPQKPVEVAKPKPAVQPTKPEVMKNAKAQPIEKIPERQGQGRLVPASKESILPQSPQAPTGEEKQVTVPPVIPNAEGTGGAAPTKTRPTPTTNTAKVLGEESVDLGPALRPHIDALIKRRAAARQIGKERTFDKALADAKAMLAGEKVSPARFKNAAKLFSNDKATADILTALQTKAEEANKAAKAALKPAFSRKVTTDSKPGYQQVKALADAAWERNKQAAAVLDKFPKGPMGLTPDAVKATPEWQTAKKEADQAFAATRAANTFLLKNFPKEVRADRDAERAAKAKPAFSRSKTPAPQSQSRTRVESVINSIKAKWKNAPEVVVIDSITDAPADVQEENNRQLSMGASGEPEGFISGNKVYIVASQMKSPGDVVRVLLHESLGHFGLRGVFGAELQTILRQVAAMRPRDMETKAQQYGLDLSNEEDRLTAAEEILAEMAQANPKSGVVSRAIAAIHRWLRTHLPGFQNLRLSDSEIIQDILIPARQYVQNGRFQNATGSVAFFRSLRSKKETLEKYGLKPKGRYKTREIAAALEARQREKHGVITRKDRSDKAKNAIAEWMADEVRFEMEHPHKSGVGWYSHKFQRALDIMATEFPEIATDKHARDLLTALIAITSDGQKVVPNFAMAADLYGNFRKTREFTTERGHARKASINNNTRVLQKLHDTMGPEEMRAYLMEELTVSELKAIAKAAKIKFSSSYQAHIKLPRAAIVLGPKLGAFYANLMGSSGYLTMDRWWSRTFNRYRGTLLEAPTRQGLDRFKQLMNNPEMSDDEVLSAVVGPHDSYAAKGFKQGTEIEKAANTIYKAAFENIKDTPFNTTDRTFMLESVALAQRKLAEGGVHMSVADIQAVLWYYEKRLYGELGARQTADVSYEEAAKRVIEARAGTDRSGGQSVPGVRGKESINESGRVGDDDYEAVTAKTANTGRVTFSRSTPAATPTPLRARIDKIADTLIYNFQDRFKPLKDIQERSGPVAEDEDAALAEERYSGMVRARTDAFEEQLRDPLLKAIHDSGVAYDDVEKYLHALHAPSRNAAMREINPTEAELKSQTSALEKQRDSLAKDPDVIQYLKLRRELRDAEADIEDGIADESLAVAIKRDIAQVKKVQNVTDYTEALDKLKALRLVKPFQGDNTALSGMSDAEAKAILDKIDANGTRKALERVSALVDDITSKTRQIYVDSGLENANVIDAWNRKYEHYVPLHRDEVSGNTMPRIGQGFNIKGKESKRATGSTKDVTNILAHVVAQHEAAIIRSEKAKVDRALFAFAQRNPDPSLWTLDEAPMLRTVDPNSGLVVERVDPTYKNRPEVLTLKIDGEEHTITFNDKNEEAMRLAASMKNLGADQLGEVTQMVGKITRFLAMMNTTANPVFTARNFLRDLQTAYVNLSDTAVADKKAAVFRDVRSAIKGMWDLSRGKKNSQWAKYAQEFKNAGGQTGWMEHYKDIGERADKIKKELEAMKPGKMNLAMRTAREWGRVISDANNAVENGVRLSAYVQARKSGLSEAKAAQLAKNLTVNFNARGAQSVQLNSWYMFMNASIQGTARLVKAMGNKQVRKIVAGVILSGFLMDILARSMAGDDDDDGENDYDQLPEHVKAMNFVFMVNNRPVTIPMPYGYNFFASTGRKISEIMFRPHYSPVKSAADLASVFLDAFSPTGQAGSFLQYISPTVTDPLVQWSENKNFAGNPLRRPQSPFGVPNPEYQMGFKSTSAPAKWLAEMLNNETGGNEVRPGFVNVNPAFFDFAVSSIAGGAGRTYLQALSGPMKSAQGEDIKAKEVPFLNIFLGAKPEYQTEKKYFEAVRAVETAKNELKTYRAKGDTEMVKQILEDHGHEIRLQGAAKATKNSLARLKRRDIALDKTNPPNKRELRKQIEDQRREAMAKFNKQYRQAVEAH